MGMNILQFFREVNKLKDVRRTGWVERGVKDAETTADHSFMVTLQAIVLGDGRGLDMEKLLKMALLHDLAESKVGDLITKENWPSGGSVTRAGKYGLEKKAMEELVELLDERMGKEFMSVWNEFVKGKSKEAGFLHSLDAFERLLQAMEYKGKRNFKKPLEGFWDEAALNSIKDPELKELIRKAIKSQNQY
jgi:putative hydrolase of HD superfamily